MLKMLDHFSARDRSDRKFKFKNCALDRSDRKFQCSKCSRSMYLPLGLNSILPSIIAEVIKVITCFAKSICHFCCTFPDFLPWKNGLDDSLHSQKINTHLVQYTILQSLNVILMALVMANSSSVDRFTGPLSSRPFKLAWSFKSALSSVSMAEKKWRKARTELS